LSLPLRNAATIASQIVYGILHSLPSIEYHTPYFEDSEQGCRPSSSALVPAGPHLAAAGGVLCSYWAGHGASPYRLPVSLDARIESESATIEIIHYGLLSKRVKNFRAEVFSPSSVRVTDDPDLGIVFNLRIRTFLSGAGEIRTSDLRRAMRRYGQQSKNI
jgi:hypothetical protein